VRAVVQRVTGARVDVDGQTTGAIDRGLVVLVGVGKGDSSADAEYIAGKVADLRIFADDEDRMNRSVVDVGGDVLLVSQFTLFGDCRRGRRPSFDAAELPEPARALYADLAARLRARGVRVAEGMFQAMMHVHLVNDGPVTILLDSRKLF
jgi:D-tyrosyl-tRNA(Tyr) deacylase